MPREEVGSHLNRGLREMQRLVQDHTASQGRGGTGTRCDFPGLGLSLAVFPLGSKGGQETRMPLLSNSPPT